MMNKGEFLDALQRAYMMEEEMAGELIDLCHLASLPQELSKEKRQRIAGILLSIQADTQRHKEVVAQIMERIK